jgi:hypothetical protein
MTPRSTLETFTIRKVSVNAAVTRTSQLTGTEQVAAPAVQAPPDQRRSSIQRPVWGVKVAARP